MFPVNHQIKPLSERMHLPVSRDTPYNLDSPNKKFFSQFKQDEFVVKVLRNMVGIIDALR